MYTIHEERGLVGGVRCRAVRELNPEAMGSN